LEVHGSGIQHFQHPLSLLLFSLFDKLPIVAVATLHHHPLIHGYDDVSSYGSQSVYDKIMGSFSSSSSSGCASLLPKPPVEETRRFLLFHGGLPNTYPLVDGYNSII
jgi:alkyl sulfatase BDS1-like metallo-beta-lactamase superfamily hydrolase